MANYKVTMFNLFTEMVTSVQGILTDKMTLQQLGDDAKDDDFGARMARTAEMVQLAAQVYNAIEAYNSNQ